MKLIVQAYRNDGAAFEACDVKDGDIFCLRTADGSDETLDADLYGIEFRTAADAEAAVNVIDALAKRAWRQLFRNHPGAHPDDLGVEGEHEELRIIYKDLIDHDKSDWSDQEYYPSEEQRKAFVGLLENT